MSKYALLIGVKETIVPNFIGQRISVINDLALIKNLLLNNNWQQNRIRILEENMHLTKQYVINIMTQFAGSVYSRDKMFLYFTGHGTERYLDHGINAQCLVLYDDLLYDFEIRNIFRRANPESLLITVFDCCHSGSIIDFTPQINFPSTIYYGACMDSQEAISYPSGGLFTTTLCNLKQEVAKITYRELHNQLLNNISRPKPVFQKHRVDDNFLNQTIAFI